ncbi:MAG: phytanoyl-CoA dioxygenase family protein [Gammaproteobacteria bacterium]|nr:phytanoyl-CoA dioxygenase family protein [Gammaproteobacteria bacterium]
MKETDKTTVLGEEVVFPGLTDFLSQMDKQGYVVIPDWLSQQQVEKLGEDLRREVNPIRELMRPGLKTVRAHNLLAKTRCVDDIVMDSRLLALIQGHLGEHFQISVVAMFDLLPGAEAQGLHQDDGLWPIPRPHPPFVVNCVLAVDEFTKENGGTMVVPKSHLWHDEPVRQPPDVETVQLEMKPGTMVAWSGALWHGGGANNTQDSRLAIDINFNLSYLRQQENQFVAIPREEIYRMPKKLQRLVGYHWGFGPVGPGMVDLQDPLFMMDKVRFGYDINEVKSLKNQEVA